MDEKKTNDEIDQWFSTYGVITAERILATYHIVLDQSELLPAVKNPSSFYHQLVKTPLKNVLNGIILQQANDYHVYVQKLFIDYLLSGESGKTPEMQGAETREFIEEERKQLLTIGEDFNKIRTAHDDLIGMSQSRLIKIAKEWNAIMEATIKLMSALLKNDNLKAKKSFIRKSISHALIHCDLNHSNNNHHAFVEKMNELLELTLEKKLKEQIAHNVSDLINLTVNFNNQVGGFSEQTDDITAQAISYRTLFYNSILRVTELMKLLSEYKIDPEQDRVNRESLYFDKTIGEKRVI